MQPPVLEGSQCLRMTHAKDGHVSGDLECSVVLNLSQSTPVEFSDRVFDVVVGMVLNPLEGVFLADEIQRLMRLGLGAWLIEELCEARLSAVTSSPTDEMQTLHFALLDLQGTGRIVAIDIAATARGESRVPLARARLQQWLSGIPNGPLAAWVSDELAQADLTQAPLLQCGLAQVPR